jgi:predicted nicotinamide N-methyase
MDFSDEEDFSDDDFLCGLGGDDFADVDMCEEQVAAGIDCNIVNHIPTQQTFPSTNTQRPEAPQALTKLPTKPPRPPQPEPTDPTILVFRSFYRQMVPLVTLFKLLTESPANWLSVEFQSDVVSHVINDHICEAYQPTCTYIYAVLIKYMREIEQKGVAVADSLAEALFEAMQQARGVDELVDQAKCYVSFSAPCATAPSEVFSFRVATGFNQVGLVLWEAAFFLTEFALSNLDLFAGKSVLELGAGVGLTGVLLAYYAQPRKMILTDYAPEVLQNLRHNLQINDPLLAKVGFSASETTDLADDSDSGAEGKGAGHSPLCEWRGVEAASLDWNDWRLYDAMLNGSQCMDGTDSESSAAINQADDSQRQTLRLLTSSAAITTATAGATATGATAAGATATGATATGATATGATAGATGAAGEAASGCGISECDHSECNSECTSECTSECKSECGRDHSCKVDVDVILAADCVYDIDQLPNLVQTLCLLLRRGGRQENKGMENKGMGAVLEEDGEGGGGGDVTSSNEGAAATVAPATVAPATVAPATVAPATVAPATVAAATVAAATVAPATVAAATVAPATVAAATVAPATVAAATVAAATVAPATVAAATVAAATVAPATVAPATVAAATVAAATVAAATVAAATVAAATVAPAKGVVAYFASTIRNRSTFDAFSVSLQAKGVQCTDITGRGTIQC